MTSLVKPYPPIDLTDVSKPDCTAAPPSFDLLFRPTECADKRLAGGYSPPTSSSKLSIHEDRREWEKGQCDKMDHQTDICYATKMCGEQQELQEEQRQDGDQKFEQASLQTGPRESQQVKHLYGQADNRIVNGDSPSTNSSSISSCSDSRESSSKHERSSHSCFDDTRGCTDEKVKHPNKLNSDEQPSHNDVYLGDTLDVDSMFEFTPSDCSSESLLSDDVGLEHREYFPDGHGQSSAHEDNNQVFQSYSHQGTPSRSADCQSYAELCHHEWELIEIVSKKRSGGTNYYKVRWKETWEPEDALSNARKLLDVYDNINCTQS